MAKSDGLATFLATLQIGIIVIDARSISGSSNQEVRYNASVERTLAYP